MVNRYQWQEQIGESGLQEVLSLAVALKESGLFTEHELAAFRTELKHLVALQVKGLISDIVTSQERRTTAAQQPERALAASSDDQTKRIREQLRKVGSALTA